jgi:hypothetical protein
MSEEERRELIARQRNALYGEGAAFSDNGFDENGTPRPATQGSGRGQSPLASGQQTSTSESAPPQSRSRANSTSSPASNPPANFSAFDNAQQSSRTSTSSPGGSPPRNGKPAASVAPIGTRPAAQAANPALNKRSTTPLPSPLSYGFAANEEGSGDRTASAASNPSSTPEVGLGGWGSKGGVWGKNSLGVQASVWG